MDRGVIVRMGNVTAALSSASGSESDQVGGGESCGESGMISRLGKPDGQAREGAMAASYVSSECLGISEVKKKDASRTCRRPRIELGT